MLGNGLLFAPMAEADDSITISETQGTDVVTAASMGMYYFKSSSGSENNRKIIYFSSTNTLWNTNELAAVYNSNVAKWGVINVTGGNETHPLSSAYGVYNPHTALAQNGEVNVSSNGHVVNAYGGYSYGSNANDNKVTISGGSVENAYGGYGPYTASNTVTISGGTVGTVYGGRSDSGNATYNNVNITGGTVTGTVYGGYGTNAQYNTVTIEGTGNINLSDASIFGGGGSIGNYNTVNINRAVTVKEIFGGVATHNGNTLNLGASGITVTGNVNYLDTIGITSGVAFDTTKTVLTANNVAGPDNFKLDITGATGLTNSKTAGTMTLISTSDATNISKLKYDSGTVDLTAAGTPVKTHTNQTQATDNGAVLTYTSTHTVKKPDNKTVTYNIADAVTNVNLSNWDSTKDASAIPTGWTGTNVFVSTGSFTVPSTSKDILTATTANFFGTVTGDRAYGSGGPFSDVLNGVTLSGNKGGGVKVTNNGTIANAKLTYIAEQFDVSNISLGSMTWGTPRVANSSYDFSGVDSIDASGLTFTGTATAADASTDLLTGATGLGTTSYTITQPTNAAVAAEFTDGNSIAYKGTGTGAVSVDSTNVKFTINGGTLSNINLGGWTGTQNMSLPTNWTGTNIAVDTGDFDALTEDKTLFSLGANTFGTVSGAKVYKDSETVTDDTQNGVSLSGVKSGGIKVEDSGAKLQYYAETMNANGITLGNMTWGTGRAIGTGYNFANVGANGVDATNLNFGFTGTEANTLAAGTNMSLLTNATGLGAGLVVKGSPVSQSISYGIDNVATLNGTLKGNVSTLAGTVNYTVTGKTLDSVDISGWNGTATATVDSSWSKAASGISVTGSGFVTPDTVGEYNILTSGSTGFFTGAKIDSSFAYQPSGTYSETAQNITLSGKQGKGVLANSEGTSLQYKIGEAYIDNIKLGAVTYSKDDVLLDKSGSLYNYSQLTSLDTSGFSLTMTDDQKKTAAANDSMTLVKGNNTMGDIAAQSAGDSKYSYEATTGLTVGGTVSGSVSATGKNVVYQVTGNTASTLDVTSATWNTTYARPDTEISYADAVVDSSNITFSGVDNLNAGDTMTLVSNYGNGVKKTKSGVFTLANGLKGKGTAYWDSDTDSLMYKVTLGAGETQATVDAVGGTEIFIQPDGGAPHQGTINGGEAKGGGTSKGNKTTVKGGVITNGDGTGGDVFGGTSEDGPSQENTADVEDSTIAGDVVGGQSDGGPSTENKAIVKDSTVGGDVDGGRSNGDGDTEGNEADVTGSTVEGDVNGGHSGGNGDSNRNVSKVDNSDVSGDVNGGKSDGNGDANENKTDVKNGSKVGGSVTGGQSNGGNTNKNETTVSGGSTVNGDVTGGKTNGNGTSSENKTNVDGSNVGGSVIGGQSENGDANKNETTVSGGSTVTKDVIGGKTNGNGTSSENKTNVDGSNVGGNVTGGQSNGGNTNKNETTVSGGSTVNGDVTGGKTSGNGTSSENKTNVDGSNVGGSVIGGQSENGDANKNETSVTGGSTVGGDVIGGKTTGMGNANENKTNVDGSNVSGNVIGGQSKDGTASQNKTTTNNTNVGGNVIGGYSQSGNASANEASVSGGSVGGSVYGGKTDGANEASSNTVTLDGGAVINGAVYGGYSENGTAEGNIVTVKNANIHDYIYGGKSKIRSSNDLVYFHDGSVLGIIGGGCDEAISNSVTLMKGGVEEHVMGGYATTTATGNKVTLTGGTVQGSVIGGYGNGTASENSVYLGGGTVQGNTIDSATLGITIDGGVYGGYGTGATRNNSVYLYSTADVSNTSLFGGTSEATGNILNIGYDGAAWTGGGQNVKNISNFENIKYSVLPWSSSKAAVTITDGTASNLSAATVGAPQVTITGVKTLSTGDTMTLLDQSKVAAANQAIKVKENSNFTIGIAAEGTGLLSRDEQGNVIYKVDSIKATEQTHNTVMASAAGMAALTTGNDYIGAAADGLFMPENIGKDGLACYAKIGGGKLRQETGSHVNVNTWNAILAVGRKSEHKDSTFEYGAFVEYGKGNFSTFNENSQRGDGSVNYTGAGLLGKWTAKNGLYVDGSFRAGRIHESANNLLRDNFRGYGYNERSSYLGFSLGIGK